jgi:hypothetical protein
MQKPSRFLKAFDAFGIVIAILLVLAWMYGLQVRNWYRARNLKKTHPVVSLVPRPLPDTSTTREKGATLTEFGYQLDVPWASVEGHRTGPMMAIYLFSGGRGLSFWNPAGITSTVQMMKEAVERTHRRFTDFLGAQTEYDLLGSELKITPEQMSPFMQKNEAFRRGMLLDLKRVELLRSPSAMYSFEMNGLRGFQLGDPAKDRIIEIRSFDAADREFRFLFAVESGSNVKLDQTEINEVTGSVRSEASPQRKPSADPH